MDKKTINTLVDLEMFIYLMILVSLNLEYTLYLILDFFVGDFVSLVNLRNSTSQLANAILILTLLITLLLIHKEKYKNSNIVHYSSYPYRLYKRSKLFKVIILGFIILVSIEALYVELYFEFWLKR